MDASVVRCTLERLLKIRQCTVDVSGRKIQLALLEQRLAARDMAMTVSDEALAEIARVGFDPLYGARPLKRAIQQHIENPVARLVLEGRYGPKDVIPIDFRNGQFVFERVVH